MSTCDFCCFYCICTIPYIDHLTVDWITPIGSHLSKAGASEAGGGRRGAPGFTAEELSTELTVPAQPKQCLKWSTCTDRMVKKTYFPAAWTDCVSVNFMVFLGATLGATLDGCRSAITGLKRPRSMPLSGPWQPMVPAFLPSWYLRAFLPLFCTGKSGQDCNRLHSCRLSNNKWPILEHSGTTIQPLQPTKSVHTLGFGTFRVLDADSPLRTSV